MISLELSSIQAKSAEREVIASACERFIRDGGKIVSRCAMTARQFGNEKRSQKWRSKPHPTRSFLA